LNQTVPENYWGKCRKKPVEVEFREPIHNREVQGANSVIDSYELLETLEGNHEARKGIDFVIRGVHGEIYPIKRNIFVKTYDVLTEPTNANLSIKKEENK
jgi:hypothetical protein